MPVIEHQYLHYRNVLSLETQIDTSKISDFAKNVDSNLRVLNLCRNGKIVFTQKSPFVEFIIPIDREFSSNKHYSFKPEFKLVNAVRARHYGSIENIETKITELREYIRDYKLTPITPPYFIVQDLENDVYDVYIGINENVL